MIASSFSPQIAQYPFLNSKIRSSIQFKRIIKCSLKENPPPNSDFVEFLQSIKERIDGIKSSLDLKRVARTKRQWKRIFFASKKVRSVIILNVLTVIYASDIPVLKEVEAIADPAFFNMVRFGLSVLPFIPLLLRSSGDFKIRSAGLELGLWVSLGYLSQALGLLTSDAGRASFISAFTVIVVPLIDGITGATIPPLIWFGSIASLFGVAFLESSGSPPCVGDVLNILSALFFGIHMLRTEQISRKTKKEKFVPILAFEVLVVAMSSVLWFLIRQNSTGDLQLNNNFSFSLDLNEIFDFVITFPWIPALYTGLFSTALCLWAEMHAMRDISATESAIVYGMEPVWGAAFAWFILGERWDSTAWFGAALILCGSLTVQLFGTVPEKSKNLETSNNESLKSSEKDKYLSLSPVVVDSRKNVTTNPIKRQDKL
ncbi:hypothetical protein LUZ60_006298 [Juncus effusus]|nr:hypothetical protein LUZ60_006298 [Juncus effusus]